MTEVVISKESRLIKLSILILFCIPSIICILIILYFFIKLRSFRRRFQNQTLFILIFLVLINIIFNILVTFSFFARGQALIETKEYCRYWQCFDYIFSAWIIWCKAIYTYERYILVFYPTYLRSRRQKLIFHYIPLIFAGFYIPLFFIFITVFTKCDVPPQFHQHLCGGSQCLDQDHEISTFNWLFNIVFPAFIVIFLSLFLLIRIVWTRREMQRNLRNWSRNWKMIIQLLGIAIIYTLVWLPLSIVSLISMFQNNSTSNPESLENQFYFLTYLCEMAVPIIALLCWPEIMQKLHRRLRPINVASVTIGPYSTN